MCCRATHVAIMVFLIVRIEGIEGTAKPLIGLLTLLGLRATHASYVLPRKAAGSLLDYILCHIIIHTMSHHHTYYVTSSYILCHIIIHTMSHHHTSSYSLLALF